jgi:hypothetical protein
MLRLKRPAALAARGGLRREAVVRATPVACTGLQQRALRRCHDLAARPHAS